MSAGPGEAQYPLILTESEVALVLHALRTVPLPHVESDPTIQEIRGQVLQARRAREAEYREAVLREARFQDGAATVADAATAPARGAYQGEAVEVHPGYENDASGFSAQEVPAVPDPDLAARRAEMQALADQARARRDAPAPAAEEDVVSSVNAVLEARRRGDPGAQSRSAFGG